MDRVEAEAIYDSGRERCVEVILELAGGTLVTIVGGKIVYLAD